MIDIWTALSKTQYRFKDMHHIIPAYLESECRIKCKISSSCVQDKYIVIEWQTDNYGDTNERTSYVHVVDQDKNTLCVLQGEDDIV
jgi:hypothetical protein